MNQFIVTLAAVFAVGTAQAKVTASKSPASAKTTTVTKTSNPTKVTTNREATTSPAASRTAIVERTTTSRTTVPLYATADAAMMVGGGSAYPGFGIGVHAKVENTVPLFAGVDTGSFLYTSGDFGMMFPLLASAHTRIQATEKLFPVVGVALGPVFSTTGKTVTFGMFFKPGLNVVLNKTVELNAEPRLGLIDSTFVFAPHVGATFTL